MTVAMGALVCGGVLGTCFFAGLWWTVRRALAASHPPLWFASSLLLRLSFVLMGFYLIALEGCRALALCLLGFLLCRIAVIRFAAPALNKQHAP
jgi:F1F0 ATPase subunit 2